MIFPFLRQCQDTEKREAMQETKSEIVQITQDWRELSVILRASKGYRAGEALYGVSNIEVLIDKVVLLFSNPLSLQVIDNPSSLEALAVIFSKNLGRSVSVVCKYKRQEVL